MQTEFSLFLPIIQYLKNRPYYSKIYSRIISAGLGVGMGVCGQVGGWGCMCKSIHRTIVLLGH